MATQLSDVQSPAQAEPALSTKPQFIPPQQIDTLPETLARYDNDTSPPIYYGFDKDEGEIYSGNGVAIIPILRRRKQSEGEGPMIHSATVVVQMPTLEALNSDDAGASFVRETVQTAMIEAVRMAVRSDLTDNPNNPPSKSLPNTLADYVIPSERGTLGAFTELAPAMVKLFHSAGMRFMNARLLKQVLSSRSFAETQMPTVKQSVWINTLNRAVEVANKKGLDPAIFRQWLETRDHVTGPEVSDDKLNDALANFG